MLCTADIIIFSNISFFQLINIVHVYGACFNKNDNLLHIYVLGKGMSFQTFIVKFENVHM